MSKEQRSKDARLAQLTGPLARFATPRNTNTARETIEAGAMLLVLREHVKHGEWMPRLEQLGISPRLAQRLTRCAIRFHHLPDAFFDAVGSQTKLIELLRLDADDIKALSEGAEVHGVTLDTLRYMSARELRQELRQGASVNAPKADAEPVEEPQPHTLQLVSRLHPARSVEDVAPIEPQPDQEGDDDETQPGLWRDLTVAEEVLLLQFRRCDRAGRLAISGMVNALAAATLRANESRVRR